jgi:glyoxylase-like metal-dependent hydrolase (beta-lactamase superfamily II)
MDRLWGEVVPIPEANVHVLTGGETVLDDYRVEYTPGHASHHVAYLHEPTGTAFCGDVAGLHIPPTGVVFAPTPPPDIDIEAWKASTRIVEAWEPTQLAITHFGAVTEDVPGHLETVRESLDRMLEQVDRLSLEDFVAQHVAWLEERVGHQAATEFQQAGPPDQLWQGLNRYLTKQREAA